MSRVRRAVRRRIDRIRHRDPWHGLAKAKGVVHVGANTGQERFLYARLGLSVVWIEPLPSAFAALTANIRDLPRQRALQALVTDVDGRPTTLHVSSNAGLSSSILDLAQHRDVWPDVGYVGEITMPSTTLATLLDAADVDPDDYDALVLDTQGAELQVLSGAGEWLTRASLVLLEAADFEAYAGCCQVDDLTDFLGERGFREVARRTFATRAEGGSYYELLFARARR